MTSYIPAVDRVTGGNTMISQGAATKSVANEAIEIRHPYESGVTAGTDIEGRGSPTGSKSLSTELKTRQLSPKTQSKLGEESAQNLLTLARDACDTLLDEFTMVGINQALFSLRNALSDYLDFAGEGDRGQKKLTLLIMQTVAGIREDQVNMDQKRALRDAVIRLESIQVTEEHIKIARKSLLSSGLDPTASFRTSWLACE